MFRILALTDFSENAHHALAVAMRLAQRFAGEVIFAHAMAKSPVPATAPQSLFYEIQSADQERLQERLRQEVQQLYQSLSIRHREVMYQVKVVAMPFMYAIVQLSEIQNVDLIVLGSTGASGIERILMGSNTLQLMKRATRPLLIVPKGAGDERMMNITLIIRPDRFKYRGSVDILFRIARSHGATLHFLFMVEEDGEVPELEDFLARHEPLQEVKANPYDAAMIRSFNKTEALRERINQLKTDLLVVFPSSKSIWEKLFEESITEELAHHGKLPLLVFPKHSSGRYPDQSL